MDMCIKLSFNKVKKLFEGNRTIAFSFDKKDPCNPSVVINNGLEISESIICILVKGSSNLSVKYEKE